MVSPPLILGHAAGSGKPLYLTHDQRMYHTYVVGGTGSGKSKLLEYLIRQDIANWKDTRAGMLIIDPHGSLFDAIMAWLAGANATRLIVPIDLRRTDSVCGYNLLRQREGFEPSVVVSQIVDTIAYAWGADGVNATPQFGRWMSLILGTLYHLDMRFVDALRLIRDAPFRRRCIEKVTDHNLRGLWQLSEHLKPETFFEQVNSSLNRLPRFLGNANLRMAFAQEESFDFRQAMDEGWIVLVCLGEDNGQISRSDASTLGTLLLSDLWTAAKQRGKPSNASRIEPFFVYLDEFQTTITPTIAENLEQARGYGLWMTLAHQAPHQLKRQGSVGEGIFRSILTNTGNKIVFRSDDLDDLDDLAGSLYLGSVDFDKEKYRIETTKVLEYVREEIESTTTGTSSATSSSKSEGKRERPDDTSYREVAGWSEDESEASSESTSESTTTTESLVPVLGKELSNIVHEGVDEQLWRAKQALFGQLQRRGVAKLSSMRVPVAFESAPVSTPTTRPSTVELYTEIQRSLWPFFKSSEEARAVLHARESGDLESAHKPGPTPDTQSPSPGNAEDDDGHIWRRVR